MSTSKKSNSDKSQIEPSNTNGTRNALQLQDKIDIQHLQVDAKGQRLHSMRGYNPRFTDIVDYIIRITHEIWEEKAVGTLYDYYANTIQIHTSDGTIYGREAVIASTLASMAAFPDRRLFGDEVIWGGDDEAGFYTSHRLTHAGTNRGWTPYSPPTNNAVQYRAIADCFSRQNTIIEEWLIRDKITFVHQLGLDPVATAKKMARAEAEQGAPFPTLADVERGVGQLPPAMPTLSDNPSGTEVAAAMLQAVWNGRRLDMIRDFYSPTAVVESASMRKLHGHNEIQGYALNLLSPFPDLSFSIEHQCRIPNHGGGERVATRWRMRGTHTGYGVYGEPTGKPIHILGISHQVVQDRQITAEWTLFDEFALLKQIHAPS
ncbi:MAG: ester cyclase [Chloroflexota bacterium]